MQSYTMDSLTSRDQAQLDHYSRLIRNQLDFINTYCEQAGLAPNETVHSLAEVQTQLSTDITMNKIRTKADIKLCLINIATSFISLESEFGYLLARQQLQKLIDASKSIVFPRDVISCISSEKMLKDRIAATGSTTHNNFADKFLTALGIAETLFINYEYQDENIVEAFTSAYQAFINRGPDTGTKLESSIATINTWLTKQFGLPVDALLEANTVSIRFGEKHPIKPTPKFAALIGSF